MTQEDAAGWSEVLEEREGWRQLHINCFFAEELDAAKLAKAPGLKDAEDIWLEHWRATDALWDDYRPWLRALAAMPLPRLRNLVLGGYSDRSIHAELGSAAELAAILPTLERLVLTGNGTELVPLDAPKLRELRLELGDFPPDVARAVLCESQWPALAAVHLRLYSSAASDPGLWKLARIAPLFERRDLKLERLGLSGIDITPEDFAAVLASPVTERLSVLELRGPPDFFSGGVETIAAHRDRLRGVRVVVGGGRLRVDVLRELGIDALRVDEARAQIAPIVPSRW